MNNIKISVIVPVYNMDKYILEAVESFERQTLVDKEIILIDDGSTDNSYTVMKKCAELYLNVSILHQSNSGSGLARNLGMRHAKGEFLAFLDPDDFYYSDDVLEFLYNTAKEKNVPVCGGSSCDVIENKFNMSGLKNGRSFKENCYIYKKDYPGTTGYCAFIFKKDFLNANNIIFPDYLRGQDAPFFIKAIACAGGAYCCSKVVYAYRKHHKIVVFDEKKAVSLISSFRDIAKIASQHNMINIQYVVCDSLKGELGALAYKYANLGSNSMNELIVEINHIMNKDIIKKYEEKEGQLLLEGDDIRNYIIENEQEKIKFIDKLKKLSRIFIFGAGTTGRKVALFLQENKIRVDSFLVSDLKVNPNEVYGIPVKEVKRNMCEGVDYLVIISTFWYLQDEIEEILVRNGINNIYRLDVRRFLLWQNEIEH